MRFDWPDKRLLVGLRTVQNVGYKAAALSGVWQPNAGNALSLVEGRFVEKRIGQLY